MDRYLQLCFVFLLLSASVRSFKLTETKSPFSEDVRVAELAKATDSRMETAFAVRHANPREFSKLVAYPFVEYGSSDIFESAFVALLIVANEFIQEATHCPEFALTHIDPEDFYSDGSGAVGDEILAEGYFPSECKKPPKEIEELVSNLITSLFTFTPEECGTYDFAVDDLMAQYIALWKDLSIPRRRVVYQEVAAGFDQLERQIQINANKPPTRWETFKNAMSSIMTTGLGIASTFITGGLSLSLTVCSAIYNICSANKESVPNYFESKSNANQLSAVYIASLKFSSEVWPLPSVSTDSSCTFVSPTSDYTPPNHELKILQASSRFECCQICSQEPGCRNFVFRSDANTCHLHPEVTDSNRLSPEETKIDEYTHPRGVTAVGYPRRDTNCINSDPSFTDHTGRTCEEQNSRTCALEGSIDENVEAARLASCCSCGGGRPDVPGNRLLARISEFRKQNNEDAEGPHLDEWKEQQNGDLVCKNKESLVFPKEHIRWSTSAKIVDENERYFNQRRKAASMETTKEVSDIQYCRGDDRNGRCIPALDPTTIDMKILACTNSGKDLKTLRDLKDLADTNKKNKDVEEDSEEEDSSSFFDFFGLEVSANSTRAKHHAQLIANHAFKHMHKQKYAIKHMHQHKHSHQYAKRYSNALQSGKRGEFSHKHREDNLDYDAPTRTSVYADPLLDTIDNILDLYRVCNEAPEDAKTRYPYVYASMQADLEARPVSGGEQFLTKLDSVLENGVDVFDAVTGDDDDDDNDDDDDDDDDDGN